jgi:hypothetical protein
MRATFLNRAVGGVRDGLLSADGSAKGCRAAAFHLGLVLGRSTDTAVAAGAGRVPAVAVGEEPHAIEGPGRPRRRRSRSTGGSASIIASVVYARSPSPPKSVDLFADRPFAISLLF